jgi:hypothetical protein
MIPFKSPLLLTVPPTLEKKLEALAALRTLQMQDQELARQRRAAIAALRRDFDEWQRDFAALRRRLASDVRSDVLRTLKYNPDQPRVSAGQSAGGQWTSDGGGGPSGASQPDTAAASHGQPERGPQYAALDTGTQTDASHAPAGVQYASAIPPDISAALTGDSRTDAVTKRLAQIYADTMETLARLPGQPQKYGIIVHVAFAAAVLAAGIRENMDIERSFDLPPDFPSSKKSVRPDIVLRDDSGDIVAIYDIKTGDSGIDPWRARELHAATRTGPDVPIIVMYTDEAILKNRMI